MEDDWCDQLRVNLQQQDGAASYAGWITADNPGAGGEPANASAESTFSRA
ncbi:MAG: hypothetical protein KC593_07310 [Myxococcales bacterium]|nr:hypothetical protein [Myxococcales bacterium]